MSVVILLDAGPLGLITNPRASLETRDCNLWLEALVLKEIQVKIPEIADYEVRRELLRADKLKGIKRLDDLQKYLDYVPLTTQTMLSMWHFPYPNQSCTDIRRHANLSRECLHFKKNKGAINVCAMMTTHCRQIHREQMARLVERILC